MKLANTSRPHKQRFANSVVKTITLADNSTAIVLRMLTEIYTDPLLAILREYSTNAIDANIEAGNDQPVRVSLPGEFESTLTIEDSGPGMSMKRIENVFCKYTESTKRLTNDQAGMYGIGSKSALAYTNQFIVTTVCDGQKITAVISRGINEETGEEEITFEIPQGGVLPTQDPNGTRIDIPIKQDDVKILREKAEAYFRILKPGVVLVDGKDLSAERIKIEENIYALSNDKNKRSEFFVLMGNVAYKTKLDEYSTRQFAYHVNAQVYDRDIVYEAEMGEFRPTTSRDNLDISAEDFAKKIDGIRLKLLEGHFREGVKILKNLEYPSDAFFDEDKFDILNTARNGIGHLRNVVNKTEEMQAHSQKLSTELERLSTKTSIYHASAYTYRYHDGVKPASQYYLSNGMFTFYGNRKLPEMNVITGAPKLEDLPAAEKKTIPTRCRYYLQKKPDTYSWNIFYPKDAEVKLDKILNPAHYKKLTWNEFCELPVKPPAGARKKVAGVGTKKFTPGEWIEFDDILAPRRGGTKWLVRGQKEEKQDPKLLDFEKHNIIVVTKSDKAAELEEFINHFKTEEDRLFLRTANQLAKVQREFPDVIIFQDVYDERKKKAYNKLVNKINNRDLLLHMGEQSFRSIHYYRFPDFAKLVNQNKNLTLFKDLYDYDPEMWKPPHNLYYVEPQRRNVIDSSEELTKKSQAINAMVAKKVKEIKEYYLIFDHMYRQGANINEALELIDKARKIED